MMKKIGFSNISVCVVNHGCKLNQFEGEALKNSFRLLGFKVVNPEINSCPNVTVINTCTVTEKSDRKSRNSIRKAYRKNKNGIIVVTGCYAETNKEDIKKIDGVTLVLGNSYKTKIPSIVKNILQNRDYSPRCEVLDDADPFSYESPLNPNRSRVFIKVQDGCNMNCAYCKIPLARGKSVSRNNNEVLSYIKKILDNGYKEIILTGINLGDYRYNGERLYSLIKSILKIKKDFRIRLSSIEPIYFSDKLIDVLQANKICPHFHIPVQNGSDKILRLMKRPYTVNRYHNLIDRIRSVKPDCHIATDIIVGFPTEIDKDFKYTVKLINDILFASIHVFKYSAREGTTSFQLKDDIPYLIKKKRSDYIIELKDKLNWNYRRGFCGSVLDAIFERRGDKWEAITGNYIRVKVENAREDYNLKKKLLPLKIKRVDKRDTFGDISYS